MKKPGRLLTLIIVLAVGYYLFRTCSAGLPSIITGGQTGGSGYDRTETTGSGSGKGWGKGTTSSSQDVKDIAEDIEKRIGVGNNNGSNNSNYDNGSGYNNNGNSNSNQYNQRNTPTPRSTTSTGPHFSFKGITMGGDVDDFAASLVNQGFTYSQKSNGICYLTGDFAGYQGCGIGVGNNQGGDYVNEVSVYFPTRTSYNEAQNDLNSLKSMLTQKYGQPKSSTNGNYVYDAGDGTVTLFIYQRNNSQYFAQLDYTDKVGTPTVTTSNNRRSAIDDL